MLRLGLLWALSFAACAAPWLSEDDRPTQQALEVLRVMDDAQSYGLDPERYRLHLTADQRAAIDAGRADRALRDAFERALTDSVTRFLRHVHEGRISPKAVGFHLPGPERPFDAAAAAQRLASAHDVRDTIASLEPSARPYWRLKQALADYRDLAQDRSITQLPRIARSIRVGDRYAGMSALRRLLHATGDLPTHDPTEDRHDVLDARTAEALERFQARHGLEVDGILGKRTFAALTTPFASRVRQIELTLERWRWASALERPDIVVNVPQFMLFALPRRSEPDRVLEMPVIVGQSAPHMRTPVFSADLEYVVFQPFWDVPQSIVRRELLPLIRKDPGYLERHNMEIVRGTRVVPPTPAAIEQLATGALRLRQRPGPNNALGQIKFILPNPYNVYLHATPGVQLFDRASRAFSHGCIRVSKPAELAEYVLKNAAERWDAERIEAALCSSTTRRVDLVTPLRVMIFYGTAVVTDSLGVMFVEDIYGHDARLAALLAAERAPHGS